MGKLFFSAFVSQNSSNARVFQLRQYSDVGCCYGYSYSNVLLTETVRKRVNLMKRETREGNFNRNMVKLIDLLLGSRIYSIRRANKWPTSITNWAAGAHVIQCLGLKQNNGSNGWKAVQQKRQNGLRTYNEPSPCAYG